MAFRRSRYFAAALIVVACAVVARGQSAPTPPLAPSANVPASIPETPAAPDARSSADVPGDGDSSPQTSTQTQPAALAGNSGDIADRPVGKPRGGKEDLSVKPSSPTSDLNGWLRTILALAIVLVLILGFRYVLLRRGGRHLGGRATGVVEVLTRTAVSGKHQVMLLRVGPRLLVVGDGPAGMTTLAEIDDPREVSDMLGAIEQSKPTSLSASFGDAMRNWRSHMSAGDTEQGEQGGQPDPIAPETPARGASAQIRSLLRRARGMGPDSGGDRP